MFIGLVLIFGAILSQIAVLFLDYSAEKAIVSILTFILIMLFNMSYNQ